MDDAELLDPSKWRRRIRDLDWQDMLTLKEEKESLEAIRLATHRGRPLASDSFLAKLEVRLGKRLRPLPVGRPRK